ncbi:MAG: extracellular solute-binding protein [Eubacteriales bacterium]
MKRTMLMCIVALILISGCTASSVEETKEEAIELTIWHYYGGTAEETFSYLIQLFNQTVGAENNITVKAYSYDGVSELAEAVEASASGMAGASAMPSIFASYIDDVLPLQEAGLIADLTPYFTEEELSTYYEPFIEEGMLGENQSLNILPIAKSTEVLHINKTAYDEFVSETTYTYEDLSTWEGVAEVSEAYYAWTDSKTEDIEGDGKAFFGTDGMANFMIVGTKQLGNDIFIEENGVIKHQFTEEIAKKIWDVFYLPYMQGYYSDESSYCSDDVASGEIVAYVGSTASSYYFPSQSQSMTGEYVDIECITMPYPVFEDGDAVAVQQGAGMVVKKSTVEEETAAVIFLKWFTENDNNTGFSVSTGYMPVKKEVLNIDYILAEMERDGEIDDTLPIIQATYSTYQQLEEYDLYSSIAFDGSSEARDVLESSLLSKIILDTKEYTYKVKDGTDAQEAMDEMLGEDNFMKWYHDITEQLDEVISN